MAIERRRSGLLTAGGVLAIISGVLGIIWGLVVVVLGAWGAAAVEEGWVLGVMYIPMGIVGIILGILAIVGGRRALALKSWGWALAGGICALFCGGVLGILALIFVAVSKRDFA